MNTAARMVRLGGGGTTRGLFAKTDFLTSAARSATVLCNDVRLFAVGEMGGCQRPSSNMRTYI